MPGDPSFGHQRGQACISAMLENAAARMPAPSRTGVSNRSASTARSVQQGCLDIPLRPGRGVTKPVCSCSQSRVEARSRPGALRHARRKEFVRQQACQCVVSPGHGGPHRPRSKFRRAGGVNPGVKHVTWAAVRNLHGRSFGDLSNRNNLLKPPMFQVPCGASYHKQRHKWKAGTSGAGRQLQSQRRGVGSVDAGQFRLSRGRVACTKWWRAGSCRWFDRELPE